MSLLNIIKQFFSKGSKKFDAPKSIRSFASEVTRIEGGKKSISVAQVSEVLKIINVRTNGEFYKFIKRGY